MIYEVCICRGGELKEGAARVTKPLQRPRYIRVKFLDASSIMIVEGLHENIQFITLYYFNFGVVS